MRKVLWAALLAGAAPLVSAKAADPAKLEREAREAAQAAAALRAKSIEAEAARERAAAEGAQARARRQAAEAEETRLRESLERAVAGLAPARVGPTGAKAALAASLADARDGARAAADTEAAQAAAEAARAAEAERLLASLQEEAQAFERRAEVRRKEAEAAKRAAARRKKTTAKAPAGAGAQKSAARPANGSRKMAATQRIVDGGGPIIRMFAEPTPGGTPSKGISIAAGSGATVRAPAAGRVAYAGPLDGFGGVLILDGADGYALVLGGLDQLAVRTGAMAAAGQAVGVTPSSPRSELYFEVRRNGISVDPQPWLGSRSGK